MTLTTALTVANGGTGAQTLTNHGLLLGQATGAVSATAAGSAGQLITSGGASADPTWTTATYVGSVATGDILSATGTNVVGVIAGTTATAGYVLTGNGSGVAPTWQAASGGGYTYSVKTSIVASMSTLNGYFANGGSQLTFGLPLTFAVGDRYKVISMAATGWTIPTVSGVTIFFGTGSTSGALGALSSSTIGDSVELVCNVANTSFIVVDSVGNLTLA